MPEAALGFEEIDRTLFAEARPDDSKLPPNVGLVIPRQEGRSDEMSNRLMTRALSTWSPCSSTIRPAIVGLGVSAIDSSIDSAPRPARSARWHGHSFAGRPVCRVKFSSPRGLQHVAALRSVHQQSAGPGQNGDFEAADSSLSSVALPADQNVLGAWDCWPPGTYWTEAPATGWPVPASTTVPWPARLRGSLCRLF